MLAPLEGGRKAVEPEARAELEETCVRCGTRKREDGGTDRAHCSGRAAHRGAHDGGGAQGVGEVHSGAARGQRGGGVGQRGGRQQASEQARDGGKILPDGCRLVLGSKAGSGAAHRDEVCAA